MKKSVNHKPVKTLSSLFGILPDLDMKKIYDEHNHDVELEEERDRKFLLQISR